MKAKKLSSEYKNDDKNIELTTNKHILRSLSRNFNSEKFKSKIKKRHANEYEEMMKMWSDRIDEKETRYLFQVQQARNYQYSVPALPINIQRLPLPVVPVLNLNDRIPPSVRANLEPFVCETGVLPLTLVTEIDNTQRLQSGTSLSFEFERGTNDASVELNLYFNDKNSIWRFDFPDSIHRLHEISFLTYQMPCDGIFQWHTYIRFQKNSFKHDAESWSMNLLLSSVSIWDMTDGAQNEIAKSNLDLGLLVMEHSEDSPSGTDIANTYFLVNGSLRVNNGQRLRIGFNTQIFIDTFNGTLDLDGSLVFYNSPELFSQGVEYKIIRG